MKLSKEDRFISEPEIALKGGPLSAVQLTKRKVFTLPLERLRPYIRIAHRLAGPLQISERMILDHELVFITKGYGRLQLQGKTIPLQAGSLLVIPPFVAHAFSVGAEECAHIAIHFDFAKGFPAFAGNLQRRPPYEIRFTHDLFLPSVMTLQADEAIPRWLSDIVFHFGRSLPTASLLAEALLLNVLAILLDPVTTSQATYARQALPGSLTQITQARMARALEFVEQHLAEHVTPAVLAEKAGLSETHFTRQFARWTGYSPHEYVQRRRIEHARKLLGDIGLSIKDVALRSGFEDPYYFAKAFRRIDGLTPSQFREALLAGRFSTQPT